MKGCETLKPMIENFTLETIWGGIGVKIKVAFHCADLVFYVVVFAFTDAESSFYDGDPIL